MYGKKPEIKSIRNRKKIRDILVNGKFYKTESLKFYFLKNDNLGSDLEFLISVPKKKIKLAVTRNYLKRIIREVICNNNQILNKLYTKTMFIVVFNKNCKIKYVKLEKEILTFTRKIEQ